MVICRLPDWACCRYNGSTVSAFISLLRSRTLHSESTASLNSTRYLLYARRFSFLTYLSKQKVVLLKKTARCQSNYTKSLQCMDSCYLASFQIYYMLSAQTTTFVAFHFYSISNRKYSFTKKLPWDINHTVKTKTRKINRQANRLIETNQTSW